MFDMGAQPYTHIVAVGACYIDTILTVPSYPAEDAKQRASVLSKRRGGNCPNTIEVLQLLLFNTRQTNTETKHQASNETANSEPELVLFSTLPSEDCTDTNFIINSFNAFATTVPTNLNVLSNSAATQRLQERQRAPVNLNHAIYRSNLSAASSYIIQSASTNSRTIVNYNELNEMTLSEFQHAVTSLLDDVPAEGSNRVKIWFQFEGRIPETTLQCIQWLRSEFRSTWNTTSHTSHPHQPLAESEQKQAEITISVECEKPAREGLEDLATHADVVFYSRSWAEGKGHNSAAECCVAEAERIAAAWGGYECSEVDDNSKMMLCCTWGDQGATVLDADLLDHKQQPYGSKRMKRSKDKYTMPGLVSRPPWTPSDGTLKVIDSIGAGDTWIAGMLFSLTMRPEWPLKRRLEFANEVAGRKVITDGFDGLGWEMKASVGD